MIYNLLKTFPVASVGCIYPRASVNLTLNVKNRNLHDSEITADEMSEQ